jgi:carbon monoxide dehydrogenase subunit G
VKISYGATVALPPDQTFAFVSDPSNWPLFILGLQSVDKGEDWGAVGGHAQMTNVLLGKSFTSELELTEWDPPKAFRYTVRQTGAPEIDNRRVYEPVSGGTRLRGTSEATPRAGLGGLADRLRMWALRRMMNKSMAQLPDAALQHGITT